MAGKVRTSETAPPRHKRRSVPHNKHTVFPGMRTPTGVTIVSGSIKGTAQKTTNIAVGKSISYNDSDWVVYDAAAKKLGSFGSAVPLQIRRRAEDDFTLAYNRLTKNGKIMKIKNKYSAR
jgi:hypothetical protein